MQGFSRLGRSWSTLCAVCMCGARAEERGPRSYVEAGLLQPAGFTVMRGGVSTPLRTSAAPRNPRARHGICPTPPPAAPTVR